MYNADTVIIRNAATEEWDAIDRLAQLDSAPPPPRDQLLVAEVAGEMRAAVSVRNGYAIADPFAPSVHVLELLRARADQLRASDDAGGRDGLARRLAALAWLRPHRSPLR